MYMHIHTNLYAFMEKSWLYGYGNAYINGMHATVDKDTVVI